MYWNKKTVVPSLSLLVDVAMSCLLYTNGTQLLSVSEDGWYGIVLSILRFPNELLTSSVHVIALLMGCLASFRKKFNSCCLKNETSVNVVHGKLLHCFRFRKLRDCRNRIKAKYSLALCGVIISPTGFQKRILRHSIFLETLENLLQMLNMLVFVDRRNHSNVEVQYTKVQSSQHLWING